jgi:hypothetical protein
MMGGNRFLRVCRVKPDRRQKNKGYQSLPANYYAELALPRLPRHDAPQKAKDRFYIAPSGLTLMTSQARSDSVREARVEAQANSGAIGRAVQVVGGTSRRKAAAVSIGNTKFEA